MILRSDSIMQRRPRTSRGGRRTLLLILLLPFASACERQDSVAPEILFELRQLRQAAGRASPAKSSLAAEDLRLALSPLEDTLRTLLADQQDLRTRQLALTDELQRWTGLLAKARGAGPETETLSKRLEKLEQELRSQDRRHQEVQELLRQSLEKTSERIQAFLERLEGVAPSGPDPGKTGGEPKGESGTAFEPDRQASASQRPVFSPKPSRAEPWNLALLGVAVVVAAAFAWRCWRGEEEIPAETGEAPRGAENNEELWTAAALLSEAVDRLKGAPPPPVPAASGSSVPAEADLAEWLQALSAPAPGPARSAEAASSCDAGDGGADLVVVPEEGYEERGARPDPRPFSEEQEAFEPPAARPPSEGHGRASPLLLDECLEDCPDAELVEAVAREALRADPWVEQEPAPVVERSGRRVSVRCRLKEGMEPEAETLRAMLRRLARR
ncbi:MAG: hypothetical protein Fur0037_14490 [Planctomycetota bacterium]